MFGRRDLLLLLHHISSRTNVFAETIAYPPATHSSLAWSSPGCATLARHLSDRSLGLVTRLVFTTGAASAVLDPLIYALWYRPVQRQVRGGEAVTITLSSSD